MNEKEKLMALKESVEDSKLFYELIGAVFLSSCGKTFPLVCDDLLGAIELKIFGVLEGRYKAGHINLMKYQATKQQIAKVLFSKPEFKRKKTWIN